jgi:lipoprotein-anchoring transpeptidase ErfK/SrfK
LSIVNSQSSILISISHQRLELRSAAGELLFTAPCSTGAAGTGSEPGSGRTPLGRFVIYSKHGENAPLLTVFRARVPVGLHPAASRGEDAILSRILTLHGLEPQNANTLSRFIYIHGTADIAQLGTPVSHGCIRLSPQDAATLFELVPLGTLVIIA